MIDEYRIWIPAKGHSERIPGKNLRLFCGKPLVMWSIEQALELDLKTYVLTDDPDIRSLARDARVIEVQDNMQAHKESAGFAVEWAYRCLGQPHNTVTLLPTAPLRDPATVTEASFAG